jgi:cytidylate kinase
VVILLDGLLATGKGTQLTLIETHFPQAKTISSGIFFRVFTWLYLHYSQQPESINQDLVDWLAEVTTVAVKGEAAHVRVQANQNRLIDFYPTKQELRSPQVNSTIGNIAALTPVLNCVIGQQSDWVNEISANGIGVMDGRQGVYIKDSLADPRNIFLVYLYASAGAIKDRVIQREEDIRGPLTAEQKDEALRTALVRDRLDVKRDELPALDYQAAVESGKYDLLIDTTELTPLQVFYLILQGLDEFIQR